MAKIFLISLGLSCILSVYSEHDVQPPYQYEVHYFEQKLDHFNFENKQTFLEKYVISKRYWKPKEGPIFFYTGAEESIDDDAQSIGLVWDWAPQFGALVVFAEHRYYGESLPKGNASDPAYYGHLSSVQALADYAYLITSLKENITDAKHVPVVAFGGSYGGMLSAWMRAKYPNIIQMALASSAPLYLVANSDSCESFSRITTEDFHLASPQCPKSIRQSWNVINSLNTTEGRAYLSKTFKLCDALNTTDDVDYFKLCLVDIYGNSAMEDYPSSNVQSETLSPIQEMCTYLNDSHVDDRQLMQDIADAIMIYMNSSGDISCVDMDWVNGDPALTIPWDYQCCTEQITPECSNGISDMFEPMPWDFQKFAAECNETYGVIPDLSFQYIMFGGVVDSSRIIFSNGGLDPWSGGGIQRSLSSSLVAVHIAEGAHCSDLHIPSPDDPVSVIQARNTEKSYINRWLKEYWNRKEAGSNGGR